MKDVRSRSLRHIALKLARWAILLFPLSLTGCFDSQSATNRSAQRKTGIPFINRYFPSGQRVLSEKASEDSSAAESAAYLPTPFSKTWDLAQGMEELDIALPDFVGSDRSASRTMIKAGSLPPAMSGRTPKARNSPPNTTALLFSKSFDQFFSSVFNQNKTGDVFQALKEELPNPFTEARQKQELSTSDSADSETKTDIAEESTPKEKEFSQEAKQESKSQSQEPAAAPTAAGIPLASADRSFLIIGDFDGTGALKALTAGRSGDTVFISDDGERDFNLYMHPDAVGQESSFYIDDIDGDGITDLLVTSRQALFGAVLLGDGNGGYRVADKFVTGYEPTIPSAGPNRSGKLEILTVNTRTGVLTSLVSSDRYRVVQTQTLSFLPNYLLHLIAPGTSRDFLMAGQVGGMEQILGWGDDNILRPTSDSLGADAKVLSGSFGSSSVQAYQVGSYASLVLGNQGKSFNVANLRLLPQTFLVLGDFYGQGSLDVAVGSLLYFNPKK
jgi:hypothetical protein